jgi:hypothetical protein
MDVKTSFFNGVIEEEVYTEKPQGFRYTQEKPMYEYSIYYYYMLMICL